MDCPVCGVLLEDPELCELQALDEELAKIERQRARVLAARQSLIDALRPRLPAQPTQGPGTGAAPGWLPAPPAPGLPPPPSPSHRLPPPPPPGLRPGSTRQTPELAPARLGILLLGVGVALVALAALIFAAVAWPELSDTTRAGVLLAATTAVGVLSAALRHRLPATSEALSALLLGLLLVDWHALSVAGWGTAIPATGWWALGTGLVAAVAAGVGIGLDQVVARTMTPVLAWAAVVLAIAAFKPVAPMTALALASVVALAVPLADRLGRQPGWRGASVAAGAVAFAVWVAALVSALVAVATAGEESGVLSAAMAVASLAGAPTAWRVLGGSAGSSELDAWLSAVSALAVGAGLIVGVSGTWDAPSQLVVAAVTGVGMVAAGRLLPGRWSAGLFGAGVVFLSVAAVPAAWCATIVVSASLVGLAPWSDDLSQLVPGADGALPEPPDVWLVSTIVAGLAVAIAALATRLPGHGRAPSLPATGAAVGVGAGLAMGAVVVPAALGLRVADALVWWVIVLVGAAVLAVLVRRPPVVSAAIVLAGGVSMPATAWWAVHRWSTVAAISAFTVASGGVAAAAPRRWRPLLAATASAAALVDVGTIAAALEVAEAVIGPIVVTLAGGMVVGAAWCGRVGRAVRTAVGAVAAGGAAAGLLIASVDPDDGVLGLAVGLTVAAVAVAVAGIAPSLSAVSRSWARWGLAGLAVGAWWAWMAQVSTTVVEAYTLPAAVVLGVAGLSHRRTSSSAGSWSAYGPALVIGFGPSLMLALGDDGWLRPVLVLAAGGAALGVGARARLQAPVVVGAAVLLLEAVDTLAPVVALVPRWLIILLIGLACVWAGATFERRVRDVRRGSELLRRFR
ncbi:MAG: hypothetical protein WHS89_06150 [Acidimicrobiales bacterium]